MKNTLRLALALCALVLLTACGERETVEKGGTGAAEPSVQDAAPEIPLEVENNGGQFVKVGDRVYFRKYGPDALDTLAVFGEFTQSWHATGRESEIAAYDPATGETETVFTDTGYGALYYGDGGFYLQERTVTGDSVVWYSLDGSETRRIADGMILGITDDALLAVERPEGNGARFSFYQDGELVGDYLSPDGMLFAGLSEDGLFLIRTDSEGGEDDYTIITTLYQLLPDGTSLYLGELPENNVLFSIEPEQFVTAGDTVGFVVGYYAGTGHFLNDWVAFTASPGVEDSLALLSDNIGDVDDGDEETEYDFEDTPKLAVGDGGEIETVPHVPGELEISWQTGTAGDLLLHDGTGWLTAAEGLCPSRVDGSGFERISQSLEYVDSAVYAVVADAFASPLDDIGWRNAYALLGMEYLAIDPRTGDIRELDCVDHGAQLMGNVWFSEDRDALLWQQISMDPDAFQSEADRACLIPISPDAAWFSLNPDMDSRDAILADAREFGEAGTPDYYGYPVPHSPDGQLLFLQLNREGNAVFLTDISPDALLEVEIGVTEEELDGAVEMLNLSRRDSDEDTPWYWARLTALNDDVTVRLERTPDDLTITEELAGQEGVFVPGSTLLNRTLQRGETVGVRVSLPWHPELRVSAFKNGTTGSYIFGEDNYLHLDPEEGKPKELTLAGYPLEEDPLSVTWLYRDAETGEHTLSLSFGGEGTAVVEADEDVWQLAYETDSLYAASYEKPDLLCLTVEDPDTVEKLDGFSGSGGDYRMERFTMDGETILRLIQANNGDGILSQLFPGNETVFVLHRYTGAAEPSAPPRNGVLTAEVVKADRERGLVWFQSAEAADEWEDGGAIYRANPYAPCLCAPVSSPSVFDPLDNFPDPAYPMAYAQVNVDRDGTVISIEAVEP